MTELVVVAGPTAAGKTVLGAELARRIGGEVVSADAFAVYRGLDIGTTKPEPAVRAVVPHHLIDIAEPGARYSAGEFVRDADAAIAGIRGRGRMPVVVGGTHFYVRALLFGLFPEPPKDAALRRELEAEWARGPAALRARLAALDPAAAVRIAAGDRQRTLRALEVSLVAGRGITELWHDQPPAVPRYAHRILGLAPPRGVLHARIAGRVERMFAAGLLDEVRQLLSSGLSPSAHAMKAIGYRESCRVLAGELTEAEAVAATIVATRRLAKRQMTWLRGEEGVRWLPPDLAEALAAAEVEALCGTGTGAV